ncbi:MAG TPA: DUF1634 domain-containing protein [Puia sp.]|jgi:uncharacterized membrane protein|nr:DUF1634 domain-containing protein [Puia sp.]
MPLFKKKITDTDMEIFIGQLLRYGVLLSSLIVVAGGAVYLYRHGQELPQYHDFKGEPDKMKQLGPLLQAIGRGEGRPLVQLGLFMLIATPIARIAFSVIGYLLEKDYLYVMITVLVLAVILCNF